MEKEYDLGSSLLGDGATPIFYDGEVIEVGTAIFTDEAMTMAAADDRWVLEDGRTIVVLDGKVSEVVAVEVPNPETAGEDLAEAPVTDAPVTTTGPSNEELVTMFDELRGVIADLSSRLDALENVEPTTEEEATYAKVKELEEKVQILSGIAGAPSIKVKSDLEIKKEQNETYILERLSSLKKW
jgi:hypothetical protein